MSTYEVKMDIFFTETHEVEADNEAEAFDKAKELVNHGMGEEVTLFEITELSEA